MPTDSRIFINYRREELEAAAVAGRLHDRIADAVGHANAFMDVGTLLPGQNFRDEIAEFISSCTAFLALIGPRWETLASPEGSPRLVAPEDLVRIEIETALGHGVYVIPVLVERATMPSRGDLPPSLHPLVNLHAVDVRHPTFRADAAVLLDAIVGGGEANQSDAGGQVSVALIGQSYMSRRFRVLIQGAPHTLEWRGRTTVPDEVLFDGAVVARNNFVEAMTFRRRYHFTPPVPNAPAMDMVVRRQAFMSGIGGVSVKIGEETVYSEGSV